MTTSLRGDLIPLRYRRDAGVTAVAGEQMLVKGEKGREGGRRLGEKDGAWPLLHRRDAKHLFVRAKMLLGETDTHVCMQSPAYMQPQHSPKGHPSLS